MGDVADNILSSMELSEDNKKKYEPVKTKFDEHFIRGEKCYIQECQI